MLDGVLALDESCVVEGTEPLRAEGVLDTSTLPTLRPDGITYRAVFRFLNYEPDLGSRYPRIAIPYEMILDGVSVEIRRDGVRLDTGALPNPFLAPIEGSVGFAASADEPGRGVGVATVLPAAYLAAIDSTLADGGDLELRIQATAFAPDGAMRTSTSITYPIHVCLGCLVTCVAPSIATTPTCNAGQDDPSTVHCE